MPRTTYLLDAEQRAFLHSIATQAKALKRAEERSTAQREKFKDMIVTGKAMGIPYTRMSKAAGLSPERLSQIDKERAHE